MKPKIKDGIEKKKKKKKKKKKHSISFGIKIKPLYNKNF